MNVPQDTIWHCVLTGKLHTLDDRLKPHKGCYCFNCKMARLNKEVDDDKR